MDDGFIWIILPSAKQNREEGGIVPDGVWVLQRAQWGSQKSVRSMCRWKFGSEEMISEDL